MTDDCPHLTEPDKRALRVATRVGHQILHEERVRWRALVERLCGTLGFDPFDLAVELTALDQRDGREDTNWFAELVGPGYEAMYLHDIEQLRHGDLSHASHERVTLGLQRLLQAPEVLQSVRRRTPVRWQHGGMPPIS
jgi:hypothetical protein